MGDSVGPRSVGMSTFRKHNTQSLYGSIFRSDYDSWVVFFNQLLARPTCAFFQKN